MTNIEYTMSCYNCGKFMGVIYLPPGFMPHKWYEYKKKCAECFKAEGGLNYNEPLDDLLLQGLQGRVFQVE